jgi:zinc protease
MKNFLSLVAMLAACASASAGITVQRHVLANGLVVILYEDHKLPQVTSYVWYKVGSANEAPGKSGFAHLFEHFMFEGSPNVPPGTILKLSGKGCNANASTSFDRTDYIMTCPSNMLEELLRLESDRMGFLEQAMTQGSFEKQREIVENEKREGDNKAYAGVYASLYRGVYSNGHPYSKLPIGSAADLDASTLDDARKFHAQYYWPNNAVLVISGDHDCATTLRLVNKWYGGLNAGPVPAKPVDLPGVPAVPRQDIEETHTPPPPPILLMAWRIPAQGQPGSDELSVLATLLAGGRTSPLVKNLTIKRPILNDISADTNSMQYGGMFIVQATPADGVSLKDAQAAVEAELAAALAGALDGSRLKSIVEGAETSRLNSLQSAAGLVSAFAESEARTGDPLDFEKDIARLRAIKLDDVRRAGRQYLVPENRATITVAPKRGTP